MSRIRRWTPAVTFVSAFVVSTLCANVASAQSPINQWRRWETTITAARNYTTGSGQSQGNPYRDLVLRVRFTDSSTGGFFIQDAFWTGNTGGPTQFKVRTLLPAGNWAWRVESCTGTTGGFNCATDANLTPGTTGNIVVNAVTSSGVKLYDRGALTQLSSIIGGGAITRSHLLYDDFSSFFWGGDTAWVAPPREISGQQSPSAWVAYLDNRKAKGFSVVLVAPAPAWAAGPDWPALPAASGFSFDQVAGCSSGDPIPNVCSRPRPVYWNAFDNMVKQANDRDLVVGIVGVVDPVGLGGNNTFPNSPQAVDFARYVAARMGGSHVVFSPAFDIWATHFSKNGTSMQTVMNDVGNALKAAAPRHRVTNHLAGQSPCDHYQWFKSSGWMTFYLFQSGHASGNGGNNGVCPGKLPGESALRAAMRRVREMPLTLRAYTNPKMPAYNGEAVYDGHPNAVEPDTRYRVRQAGHVTMLSGGAGYTYGTSRLWQWYQVGNTIYNLGSATDMQRLILRFKDRSSLTPRHEWILNQTADPNHENKMVLASDSFSTVLAYLPGGATSIRINTASLSGLTCASGLWTKKWFNPPNNVLNTQAITCTQGTGWIQLNRPPTCGNANCDWVLELYNTGVSTLSAPAAAASLAVWTDRSADDGTTAIVAESTGGGGGGPFVVSPAGEAFQGAPQVARLGDGHLVVWQADGPDGSLHGVFAQRYDAAGRPRGDRFQVNEWTEGDQRDPVVVADALGNALLVWSSYGQDGDRGAIVARLFDRHGWPMGREFAVNEETAGHQERPLAGFAPDGGFAVAWSRRGGDGEPPAVAYRRFDPAARPLGGEVRFEGRPGEAMQPTSVEPAAGFVTLRWLADGESGEPRREVRRFDDRGREAMPPLRLDLR